jgi:hypothetical protein
MTQALIKRRDKVSAAWLNQVCPVVDPVLARDGGFTFSNASMSARAATAPESYQLHWFRFDNATSTRTPMGEPQTAPSGEARAPAGLLDSGEFVGVSITARHPQHPGWAKPSVFFFRRGTSGWTLVGVERG